MKITQAARHHLLRLWRQARHLYHEAEYPLAGFLAVTLFEEVGKLVLVGTADLSGGRLDKKAFYSHDSKYREAVWQTLLVNSRLSHVYGSLERRFASWFRTGELFKIRNRCLYLEHVNETLSAPTEVVTREDVALLVCFAGESLAEIQGHFTDTGPEQWMEILREVDEFRATTAISSRICEASERNRP